MQVHNQKYFSKIRLNVPTQMLSKDRNQMVHIKIRAAGELDEAIKSLNSIRRCPIH